MRRFVVICAPLYVVGMLLTLWLYRVHGIELLTLTRPAPLALLNRMFWNILSEFAPALPDARAEAVLQGHLQLLASVATLQFLLSAVSFASLLLVNLRKIADRQLVAIAGEFPTVREKNGLFYYENGFMPSTGTVPGIATMELRAWRRSKASLGAGQVLPADEFTRRYCRNSFRSILGLFNWLIFPLALLLTLGVLGHGDFNGISLSIVTAFLTVHDGILCAFAYVAKPAQHGVPSAS